MLLSSDSAAERVFTLVMIKSVSFLQVFIFLYYLFGKHPSTIRQLFGKTNPLIATIKDNMLSRKESNRDI